VRSGLVDDAHYARARADALARRGAGDAFVRFELHRAGVADELVEDALAALPPEAERAERVVARRGRGARTARYLRAKGFSEDVVADVAGESASGLG
jgi:SOS response regulatory protein OraA/RecX